MLLYSTRMPPPPLDAAFPIKVASEPGPKVMLLFCAYMPPPNDRHMKEEQLVKASFCANMISPLNSTVDAST